ncbi:uncharacterized protein IUM83_15217 [Phytophthora cinnamomi]|uniref:uncharacterized protein n=1 Tax=Phytophthora cinnamomi TaxID=4785 RepID=UPI00355944D3|nr:hypothetical protein IUM83_15217 [Phytophthora cinnamomi]
MAERKRWDKQQDFHPSRADSGSASSAEAKADPVLTKQLQYIKVLEERNRVKKRLAAASKRSDRLQEREEAFVTAFNVPARGAAAQATATSSLSSRNSRSATTVLPTKLATRRDEAKLSKCRSAPSTTLNFGPSSDAENRVRRAKWNRPQAPMGVAVEHQDGVPLFRLTTREEEEVKSEQKGGAQAEDTEVDEEESYLEESFEEFEDDEDERESAKRQELVVEDFDEEAEGDDGVKPTAAEQNTSSCGSPVDLSRTTKELVGIIQHLSRTKQRALVDVLQKFQSSEQDESDVKVLQSSIGDPAIWKEIASTLNAPAEAKRAVEHAVDDSGGAASSAPDVPTVAPLKNLLEEQLRWEDQYANEMKERLEREREVKQRILKEAEERRAKMMRQLEDEEREIERLMEVKRQERLAKLRALQEEAASADTALNDLVLAGKSYEVINAPAAVDDKAVPVTKLEAKSKGKKAREDFPMDEGLYAADAKSELQAAAIRETSEIDPPKALPDSKLQLNPIAVVPKLNLSGSRAATSLSRYEIRVKLFSTWSKTRVVGLTQICVYDLNGEELNVNLELVQLFDQPTGKALPRTNDMVRGLHKLFNGVVQTNVEKDMWLGRFGDSGVLLVSFEVLSAPSKLCIWNYNSKKHTACTRDIEVLPSFVDTSQTANDTANTGAIVDIPILPNGKWLQIEILSTWGDPYYVGLNGVEIFDHRGELVKFNNPSQQVTACPESINVLEENSDDPRVAKNLVDGVNFTCDDFHMWLAPFTPGQAHYVLLEMNVSVSVSMVRIWNYNKSRTHTCRGVREARLILYESAPIKLISESESKRTDNEDYEKMIFEGEIRQAPGLVGAESMEISNEVILFTQEAAILEAIEANDEALRTLAKEQQREDEDTREFVATVHRSMELQRPRTSDAGSRTVEQNQESDRDDRHQLRVGNDGRPMTMATRSLATRGTMVRTSIDSWVIEEPQQRSPDALKMSDGVGVLHSTWGDKNYIGLTQVDVLVGSRGTPIPLDVSNVDATPRDLASIGYVGDPRTIDKLVDGEATTCDDAHMWLVPLEAGSVPEVRIELKTAQYFYGLRIWNYNKSPEDTYRGAKQLVVLLDGVAISPNETGFLLRKAPGVADFDFGQLVRFSEEVGTQEKLPTYAERVRYPFITRTYKTPIIRQDYEAPLYPQGFLLKIICWTTWGDPYYLGLNGFELYDFAGARIIDKPSIITAVPYSVSELDNSSGRQQDTRTPNNLLSGLDKNTWEAHDSWLAPLASSLGNQQGNIVYIGFDTPVVLSMIKFWNYSKTPERGVKDVDIYLDDMHLFSGTLRKTPVADANGSSSRFGKVHKVTEQFGQPVLFSSSQAQVDSEKRSVYYCGVEEQDVLGINEGQVMQESRAMYRKPDPGAEGVVVDLDLRPMTAVCRQ